jgi:hypothetical protein
MRTLFSLFILLVGLLVVMPPSPVLASTSNSSVNASVIEPVEIAPATMVQEEGGVQVAPEQTNVTQEPVTELVEGGNFFSDNWGALLLGLLGFFDLVARLTPTEKDNSIVNFLLTLFNAIIPNLKKGGGSFRLLSK